ncbi:MAG TPA: UDP-N-acetylmuramoyl-tripeptide--D-alanyl-D-alanine ligase [Acidimicrobiales bacterium]|jgi:UDP-N-acetylmuramoyl-tripeptide--D-alanyl-D-alanine ligase|nr:UDP-N-acetylmuramoyl-tripeptide--D-alanyl-D-alanine ligase [Acidimicrobiales bacterium]
MQWTAEQIADATGARIVDPRPGAPIGGVSIDTRTIRPGDLFVALRAERDGHEFAAAAVAAGAGALLVERSGLGTGRPEIVVADTQAALLALGRAARARLDIPVAGITGSVGKTSTKDMAAAALAAARRTVASAKSFNNELGLPLTLANAPADAEVVVLEMGARGPGHISLLCGIGRPQIGVVTAVAAAHTEMFGDLDGVARAKGELIEWLPADGTAVLNHDDPRTLAMRTRSAAPVLTYSTQGHGDVNAHDISLDQDLRPRFRLHSPWGQVDVELEARGRHQVGNALAALAVAASVGVPIEQAAAALTTVVLSPMRMEIRRAKAGGTVINDAYNANPASMAAALQSLAAIDADRRIAVLGPMAELGVDSAAEHRAMAHLAAELGIEIIAVGTDAYGPAPAADPVEEIGVLDRRTAVLVKASRVAALEEVAARLVDSNS